jgi:hypothetical protein
MLLSGVFGVISVSVHRFADVPQPMRMDDVQLFFIAMVGSYALMSLA